MLMASFWPHFSHCFSVLFVCTSVRPTSNLSLQVIATFCWQPFARVDLIEWFLDSTLDFGAVQTPKKKTKLKKNLKLINFSVWHKYFKFICLVWWKSLKCLAIIKANYEKYEYHQSATVCWGSRRRTDRQTDRECPLLGQQHCQAYLLRDTLNLLYS